MNVCAHVMCVPVVCMYSIVDFDCSYSFLLITWMSLLCDSIPPCTSSDDDDDDDDVIVISLNVLRCQGDILGTMMMMMMMMM